MSGINSTVRINDGMSPAMKSMNKALNIVLSNFEKLQSISGNAIDTSDITSARAELNNAAVAVARVEEELEQAANKQKKFTDEVEHSESAMSDLVKKVAGLVAGYVSFQTLMGAVNLSDSISQTESRLNLIVDEEAGESVDELTAKIMESANRSRSAYLDTASVVASFAQRAGDSFNSNDEVIAFAETLNKMYVIAGASAEEQSSSMLQLTQALGSGVLRGEEFNAVFEAAPNIMQAVADYMDVPIGKLRDMAAEGMITADIVKNAIFNATEQVNEDFESMNMTWAQVMTLFKNRAIESLEPVLDKINELANNKDVQNFALGLGNSISIVANIALGAFEILAGVASFMYDNWSFIAPIIGAVTAALALYTAALIVHNAIESFGNIQKGIAEIMAYRKAKAEIAAAAATGMQASATATATVAQAGFNTVLLASPITWILLIIIAIVAAIYLVIAAINKVTGSTISATGIIVGALAVAGAFVWNLFLGILDLVLAIVNIFVNQFIRLANFFGNVFRDPIASVLHLFGSMADGVLSVLESIAKTMDKIFGSNLAGTVSGWREGLDSKIEEAAKEYGNGSYEEVMSELNLSSESLGLKRMEYSGAWDAGYDFGEGVDDKISNLSFDNLLNSPALPNLDELLKNTGDTADNTGNMADALEITEEDLKYLRDIAEQEAINRFTTAEIKIDMGGITNQVSNNTDLDGIVTYLEDKLYESMEIAAEGVH